MWCFGMVERKSGYCYMQLVPDRTARTLLGLIYDHILPNSTIYSDGWASYGQITELYDREIEHATVNHSLNFVDNETKACTNKIESYWNSCKLQFKEMHGCRRWIIQSYIDQFMWKKNNDLKTAEDIYHHIMLDIAKLYRVGDVANALGCENFIGRRESEIQEFLSKNDDGIEYVVERVNESEPLIDNSQLLNQISELTEPHFDPYSTEQAENTSEQAEKLNEKTEKISELVENIEFRSTDDLLTKFNPLKLYLLAFPNKRVIIPGLNDYYRRLLHNECDKEGFYHFSATNASTGKRDFIMSNVDSDKVQHEKAFKQFNSKNIKQLNKK